MLILYGKNKNKKSLESCELDLLIDSFFFFSNIYFYLFIYYFFLILRIQWKGGIYPSNRSGGSKSGHSSIPLSNLYYNNLITSCHSLDSIFFLITEKLLIIKKSDVSLGDIDKHQTDQHKKYIYINIFLLKM